jgi:polyribonucleotide nucleotidyltransferase
VKVKVLETDDKGRVKLSMKALAERPAGMPEEQPRERRERGDRPPRGDRGDRGDRADRGDRGPRNEGGLPPEQREQQAPREPLPQIDAADTPPQQ